MSKDLFSRQAGMYARHRPSYPHKLYKYVLQFVEEKLVAWDCATGNGQAGLALSEYFEKVIATDISKEQLAHARKKDNINYLSCPAEKTPFTARSFDLITIAQAYHWFNFEAFNTEVRRVGKPGAVIAAWGYNLLTTHVPALDSILNDFYSRIVGPYWEPERRFLEDHYSTIPFDFTLLPNEKFFIECQWQRDDLLGYLNSWSSVVHFIADKNYNPVEELSNDISMHWKENEIKQVSFPLYLKIGKLPE
ncbi:MAG: class I SAM-dependent methyltransferase [Chitinophagaceae bacterium]